jgi:RimJ/RimL family protein N-acetyltransferase
MKTIRTSFAEGAFLPPGWRPERARYRPAGVSPGRYRPHPVWRPRHGHVVLGDGTAVTLRPLVPADRDGLAAAFARLSEISRYRRFLSPMPRLSSSLLRFLTDVDQWSHFAWVAIVDEPAGPAGVGVGRFVRLADPAVAEPAITVIDDYQGRGLGGILLDALMREAIGHGITRFEGVVLTDNAASRAMLARAGARFEPDGGNVLRFSLDLAQATATRSTTKMSVSLGPMSGGKPPGP